MFVPGMMGKMFRGIPLIVIPCLLFSLVESLNILPAHLSHWSRRGQGGWTVPTLFSNASSCLSSGLQEPGVRLAMAYLTAAIGVSGDRDHRLSTWRMGFLSGD